MSSSLLEQVVSESPKYVHRLTVGQLREILKAGILPEGQPVELIDGLLVDKDRSDQGGHHGPRHASAVRRLQDLDARLRPLGFHIRTQLPITLSDVLEPEPDGAIVVGEPKRYDHRHPSADEVALVIEVADSSLAYDRSRKREIYASAGIPAFWIVNLRDGLIEVFRQPDLVRMSFAQTERLTAAGSLQAELASGQFLNATAAELLP